MAGSLITDAALRKFLGKNRLTQRGPTDPGAGLFGQGNNPNFDHYLQYPRGDRPPQRPKPKK